MDFEKQHQEKKRRNYPYEANFDHRIFVYEERGLLLYLYRLENRKDRRVKHMWVKKSIRSVLNEQRRQDDLNNNQSARCLSRYM